MPFLVFQSLGPLELAIIFAIVVVLFGASKIGDIGGSIGRGIREFRREVKEGEQESEEGSGGETPEAETSEEKKA